MSDGQEQSQESAKKLYAFVLEQMKAGADQATSTQKLVDMGMDKADAAYLAETAYAQIAKAAEAEQFTIGAVIPAFIGAGVAAVIGGALWGVVVIMSGWEIGYAAWGLGWLSGLAVVRFCKGRKGVPLQIIAACSSILGIAVGKFTIIFHYLKEYVTNVYGAETAAKLSIFSPGVFELFVRRAHAVLSPYDILWVILAVITAWRIPKGLGVKLPKTAYGKT